MDSGLHTICFFLCPWCQTHVTSRGLRETCVFFSDPLNVDSAVCDLEPSRHFQVLHIREFIPILQHGLGRDPGADPGADPEVDPWVNRKGGCRSTSRERRVGWIQA